MSDQHKTTPARVTTNAVRVAAEALVSEADGVCGRCTLMRPAQKANGKRCIGCYLKFVEPLRQALRFEREMLDG